MFVSQRPLRARVLCFISTTEPVLPNFSFNHFTDKSWEGMLVRSEPNGYKIWEVQDEKYFVVRNIPVDVTIFWYPEKKLRNKELILNNSTKSDVTNEKSKLVVS